MNVTFRVFTAHDGDGCLAVFTSNIPKFFREHERQDFEDFIGSGWPYFVLEADQGIVGCGGYGVRKGLTVADLCWGMVASEHHRTGLGEFLLLGRLNKIVARPEITGVRLGTSQHTDGFFQKYGFTVEWRKQDAIAEGIDSVEMTLEFTSELRQSIMDRWKAAAAKMASR